MTFLTVELMVSFLILMWVINMKRKLVAIGGGENGRLLENGTFAPYDTELIDKEIVRLTEKEHPNFLFLAHTFAFSEEIQEDYYQTMKKIYHGKFHCHCQILKSEELKDINKVQKKIDWADIIYEGGGDTGVMIKLWKDSGFDKILYDAWNKGKVICGISAGAVCWFKSCNSDSKSIDDKDLFKSIDCLNWINLHLTPHCNEIGRYESTKKQLKENGLVGVLLSSCAALEIIDDQYRLITSNYIEYKQVPYGIKAYWNNGEYKEIMLSSEFQKITELLIK